MKTKLEKNVKVGNLVKILPWVLIALSIAVRLIHLKYNGSAILDADCSANMVQAALKNKEGDFFATKHWFYSTGIATWQEWIFQLGLLIFPSCWRNARVLSLFIFIVIGVLAWVAFGKGVNLSGNGAWSALVMVACLGVRHSYVLTTGMMYYECIIYPISILALIFLLTNIYPNKVTPAVLWCLLLILSFGAGLDSVRMLACIMVPEIIAAMAFLLLNLKKEKALSKTIREWISRWDVRFFCISMVAMIANMVGFLVNEKVLPNYLSYNQYGDTALRDFDLARMVGNFKYIAIMLGYQDGAKFFSLEGIRSLIAVGLIILFFAGIIRGFALWNKMEQRRQACFLTCVFIVFGSLMVLDLSSQAWDVHMVPTIFFFFPILHIVWDVDDWGNIFVKGLVCTLFVCCIFVLNSWQLQEILHGSAEKTPYEKIADFLVENQLTQGFAGFWESCNVTEFSDGQVEIWTITDPWDWRMKTWLQAVSHSESFPEGRCFLLLVDDYEVGYYWDAPFANPNAVAYQEDGFTILVLDDCSEIIDYTPVPFWER